MKKGKRALQRKAKQTETDPESSDVDGDCPSTIVVDQLNLLLVQLSNSGLHHLPHPRSSPVPPNSKRVQNLHFIRIFSAAPSLPRQEERRDATPVVFAKLCTAKQMKYKLGSNTWFHGECVNSNEPEKFFCASRKMSFCKSVKCAFETVLCTGMGTKKWEGVVTG